MHQRTLDVEDYDGQEGTVAEGQQCGEPSAELSCGVVGSGFGSCVEWEDPKKTLADLMRADMPLPRQRNIAVVKKTVRPGQLEKELSILVWFIRNRLPFSALDDSIGYDPVSRTCDFKIRGADSIKNLTFAVHEVALRETVARFKDARAYSITLDYWTASNGRSSWR